MPDTAVQATPVTTSAAALENYLDIPAFLRKQAD
jgi:cell division protein FtsZ